MFVYVFICIDDNGLAFCLLLITLITQTSPITTAQVFHSLE